MEKKKRRKKMWIDLEHHHKAPALRVSRKMDVGMAKEKGANTKGGGKEGRTGALLRVPSRRQGKSGKGEKKRATIGN